MTPERLAEIEALVSEATTSYQAERTLEVVARTAVPDLCEALREAWAEIARVKELAVRLGDAVDRVLLSFDPWQQKHDLKLLGNVALTTEEWRSLGEDRR